MNNVTRFHASGSEETRDELRMQVYDAMAEKETTHGEAGATEPKGKMEAEEEGAAEGAAKSPVKNGNEHFEPPVNGVEKTPEGKAEGVKTEEQNGNGKEVEEEGEGRLGVGLFGCTTWIGTEGC